MIGFIDTNHIPSAPLHIIQDVKKKTMANYHS